MEKRSKEKNSFSIFIFPEFRKYVMVELILNPKNNPLNAIELEKRACSPLPSGPKMRDRKMEETKDIAIVRT